MFPLEADPGTFQTYGGAQPVARTTMKRCIILCQNPALAASLRLWMKEQGDLGEDQIGLKTVGATPQSTAVARAFDELADWIESELEAADGSNGVPELVALTDLCGYGSVGPHDLNPVAHHDWGAVLGMLVFAFPEVQWLFAAGRPDAWPLTPAGDENTLITARFVSQPDCFRAELIKMRKGLTPIFDGDGLRDAIRGGIADQSHSRLALRRDLVVAIDEERSYAWLHAYTAYRFGFRAQVATTYAGMESTLAAPYPQPALVFEDYFLQFSDRHPSGFSHLRVRDQTFDSLTQVSNRIIVTSGHHHGQDNEAREDNPEYLRELREAGQWNKELKKPLAGIFNLWTASELDSRLRDGGRHGLAFGFNWPVVSHEAEGGHSAPGRLLAVADRLIARTERLLSDVRSVPQAVRGAVLATDALELLGGRTPTTSLEALALKHHLEVLAECQFVGMQEHMDVGSRMEDLKREVDALSEWFGETEREKQTAAWNAELSILNKLIEVFRANNQFDEEQLLQVRARKLHRKLWFAKRWTVLRPLEIFPAYVESLVASFPLFLAAIALWIIVLGGLYCVFSPLTWHRGIADAFTSFLGVQPSGDDGLWDTKQGLHGAFWLVAMTIGLGFVHLGIFISHLYSMISRK